MSTKEITSTGHDNRNQPPVKRLYWCATCNGRFIPIDETYEEYSQRFHNECGGTCRRED